MSAPPRSRSDIVDIARAVALAAMTTYHLTWDLAYFRLIPPAAPFSPAMRLYSHAIASSFLFLVGVSLALAHKDGPRWRSFFVRLARVVAAALAVSAASYYFAAEYFIGFGILHCIAAASLIAALFLPAPPLAALVVGLAALAAPWLLQSHGFDGDSLNWTGLGFDTPLTLDWRPLLPWAGVVWLGLALTRLALPTVADTAPMRWRAGAWPTRALAFLGRHSLAYYLLHQLALFGALYAFFYIRYRLRYG